MFAPNCQRMKRTNAPMDALFVQVVIPNSIRVNVHYAGYQWIGINQSDVEWLRVCTIPNHTASFPFKIRLHSNNQRH